VRAKKINMRKLICPFAILIAFVSCNTVQNETTEKASLPIQGTWKLLTGTLIEKGDTTVTDYTKTSEFIKIINDTHFAFLSHDLNKDSVASFSAGGGHYTLKDSSYTEHLEYCNAREWEGNNFDFTITINNDTLTQKGIEKIDSIGVNRLNIERYVRLKN
jgi:hypothetical protein